jgi:hypothetical protein
LQKQVTIAAMTNLRRSSCSAFDRGLNWSDYLIYSLAKRATTKAPAKAKAPAKKPAKKAPAKKAPAKKAAPSSDEVDVDDRMHALAAQKGSKLRPNAKVNKLG